MINMIFENNDYAFCDLALAGFSFSVYQIHLLSLDITRITVLVAICCKISFA